MVTLTVFFISLHYSQKKKRKKHGVERTLSLWAQASLAALLGTNIFTTKERPKINSGCISVFNVYTSVTGTLHNLSSPHLSDFLLFAQQQRSEANKIESHGCGQ